MALPRDPVTRGGRAALTPATTAATVTTSQFAGKLLLSPTEAAHALGIDRGTVYDLLNTGELASLHIGRMRRIAVAELTRFITQRERQEAPRHD